MTRILTRCVVLAVVCAATGSRMLAQPTVFINEIHYDNTGTDAGEFIEIAGPAGTESLRLLDRFVATGAVAPPTTPMRSRE